MWRPGNTGFLVSPRCPSISTNCVKIVPPLHTLAFSLNLMAEPVLESEASLL